MSGSHFLHVADPKKRKGGLKLGEPLKAGLASQDQLLTPTSPAADQTLYERQYSQN